MVQVIGKVLGIQVNGSTIVSDGLVQTIIFKKQYHLSRLNDCHHSLTYPFYAALRTEAQSSWVHIAFCDIILRIFLLL